MIYLGNKIEQIDNAKVKDRKKKFYGRRFFINGEFTTITRCRICGKEIQYKGLKSPAHCGSTACTEWWRLHFKHVFMSSNMVRDKEFFGRNNVVKNILNNAKNTREVEDGMRRERIIPEQMIKRKVDRKRMVFANFKLKGSV